ncbi:MAG: hypothetical protein PHY91_03760 [Tissierellia bacterium]|nr:hypothetical protein [Tissierellia bacterium]MDD4726147.1 hypothetical protein [Tissierellia bacterium]
MDYLLQKVAYLRGLVDGLEIEESTKEGKVLLNIVDTLEVFADVLTDVVEDQDDLEEYVNFIDEDLADVEEDLYYGDDDDDWCCDDDDCDCCDDYDDDFEEDDDLE